MTGLKEIVARAADITKRSIAVISDSGCMGTPEENPFGISFEEACRHAGSSYKGYSIYPIEAGTQTCYVCIRTGTDEAKAEEELILLAVKSAVLDQSSEEDLLKSALKTGCDPSGRMRLEEAYGKRLCGYVLIVAGYGDSLDEVLQIMDNTLETALSFELEGRIVAVSAEENINEVCENLSKNILSELLLECTVAIGGKSKGMQDLKRMYDCCLEALYMKRTFGFTDTVLNYDRLYAHRAVSSLSPRVKADILLKVFTPEFKEMLNSELSITIEELFKNNLNLTDTAGKLYIHRNTLLYRLDKIHKCTGFDLKKFEDSWLFRLAWLINKEKEE